MIPGYLQHLIITGMPSQVLDLIIDVCIAHSSGNDWCFNVYIVFNFSIHPVVEVVVPVLDSEHTVIFFLTLSYLNN